MTWQSFFQSLVLVLFRLRAKVVHAVGICSSRAVLSPLTITEGSFAEGGELACGAKYLG